MGPVMSDRRRAAPVFPAGAKKALLSGRQMKSKSSVNNVTTFDIALGCLVPIIDFLFNFVI